MAPCCSCNSSGTCRKCRCAKSGKPCANCAPSRRACCQNLTPPGRNNSQPSQPSLSASRHSGLETLQDPTSQPLPLSTSAEGASRTQSSQREGGSSWRRRRHSCTAVAISQPLSVRRETSSQLLPVSCFVDGGSYSPQRVLPAHSQRDSDNTADGPRGVPSNGDLFSTSDASGAVSEVRNDVRTATPSSTPSLFSPNESLQDSLTCSNDGVPASRHFSDSNSNLTSTAAT